jgi:hypothetical protein
MAIKEAQAGNTVKTICEVKAEIHVSTHIVPRRLSEDSVRIVVPCVDTRTTAQVQADWSERHTACMTHTDDVEIIKGGDVKEDREIIRNGNGNEDGATKRTDSNVNEDGTCLQRRRNKQRLWTLKE